MNVTEELKPCPFCGGDGYFCETAVWWVRCDDCAADAESNHDKSVAASNWNRRAALSHAPSGAGEAEAERGALKAEKWRAQHVDTINDMASLRVLYDTAEATISTPTAERDALIRERDEARESPTEGNLSDLLLDVGDVVERVTEHDRWTISDIGVRYQVRNESAYWRRGLHLVRVSPYSGWTTMHDKGVFRVVERSALSGAKDGRRAAQMGKLTADHLDFLRRVRDGQRLALADRHEDRIRQSLRRAGLAKVVMNPRRWVITDAGRRALSEGDRHG
jgi:hypothetical protein